MLEKRYAAVPPQLLTANGTTGGAITIATDPGTLFKVKQTVILMAAGLPNLSVQIKEIINGTIYVGPFASAVKQATPITPSKPSVVDSLLLRSDVSAYTTSLGAVIFADEQKRPSIDNAEIWRAVYDEEPAVALRNILVDEDGNKYNEANPLPVAFDGTVTIADVSIVEGGNTMVVNPDGSINVDATLEIPPGTIPDVWTEIDMDYDVNNNLIEVQYHNGTPVERTLTLSYDINNNLTKVVAS